MPNTLLRLVGTAGTLALVLATGCTTIYYVNPAPVTDAGADGAAGSTDGAASNVDGATDGAITPPPADGAVTTCPPNRSLQSGVNLAIQNNAVDSVDILFEVDNSNSMSANQANLANNFSVLINQLVAPPDRNMDMLPDYPPVRSLHVGVISSDLGTPGSVVPSCASSDVGDDGLLNPIRNGQAMRTHQPWTTAPAGARPARCTMNPSQYPSFLTFDATATNPAEFREDFICNAYLSVRGCGLEQQLESAYRALVVHNPREQAGNTDPNAGFVRPNAVLAIVIVSDEEDGSVRDCRYAETGVPCSDGIRVFDSMSAAWASSDLNLRFYLYTPGSAQDPTWNLDRYMDPTRPNRGFTSLKPGRPENVIFAAIAGIPIQAPMTASGDTDLAALLGTAADGSQGFTAMSPEGPVSMQQRNMDPSCSTRVVPACRREGSSYDPMRPPCSTDQQYFALPSRRIVEVARRFQATYNNGSVSSICRNDYTQALEQIVQRIQQRLTGRCLPRVLVSNRASCCDDSRRPVGCATGPLCAAPGVVSVRCEVRERLPATVNPAEWCTPAHGRRRAPGAAATEGGRAVCLVDQVAVQPGQAPPASAHGFYYDTTPDPANPTCTQRISFTSGDSVPSGAEASIECVDAHTTPTPTGGMCGTRALGESCTPARPGGQPCMPGRDGGVAGCFLGTEIYLESGSPDCRSGQCLIYRYDEASDRTGAERDRHLYCSCRCGVPASLASTVDPRSLCTCGAGFSCVPVAGEQYDPAVRGSYCVRTSTVAGGG